MQNRIKEIVKLAGEIVKEGFVSPKEVTEKTSLVDLVTEYDVRVEDFLKERFLEEFPEFSFVGEESGGLDEHRKDDSLSDFFVVDPIDGTSNFVKGFPYVSISVAVYRGGEPYYGIVYNPIMNELYEAVSGSGAAFCNGVELGSSSLPKNERIRAVYTSGRRPNPPKEEIDMLDSIRSEFVEQRVLHSAALEMCYVAKGVYGVYATNKISPWDVAAAMIILSEAGGASTDLFGGELSVLDITNIKAFGKS